jgi:hypothetical protein
MVGMWLIAVVAIAAGLFCLLMPVRWLGYNPYRRQMNPGFDEAQAASHMWIVRSFAVLFLGLAAVIIVFVA